MSVKITYKGNEIASSSADETKTLKTSGKYCEGDIIVTNKQDGGITPSGTIEITENGETDVTEYATAKVNVPTGGFDLEPAANQIKALIRIPKWYKKQLLRFGISSGTKTATIDWGDGTVDTVSPPDTIDYLTPYSHTYSTDGLYLITITATKGGTLFVTSMNSYFAFCEIPLIDGSYNNGQTILRQGFQTRLRELHCGENVQIDKIQKSYALYLEDKSLNNITTMQYTNLAEFYIPDGVTAIEPYQFNNMNSEYIKIPASVTTIAGNAFSASAFSMFDFTDFELVDGAFPCTLSATSTFAGTKGYIVVATEEIATVLKSATNWSTYATQIKYKDEITTL